MSALPPIADIDRLLGNVRFVRWLSRQPIPDISFDQFVCTGKERRWKIEANALGGLEISNKLGVSGLFEW